MKRVNGHDDGALDALVCLALFERVAGSMPALSGPEPELDPADQEALDALGPDRVRRILEEEPEAGGANDRLESAG